MIVILRDCLAGLIELINNRRAVVLVVVLVLVLVLVLVIMTAKALAYV